MQSRGTIHRLPLFLSRSPAFDGRYVALSVTMVISIDCPFAGDRALPLLSGGAYCCCNPRLAALSRLPATYGCLRYWNKMVPRVFCYMDIGKTALVRAFELARSGKCLNISELLLRLTAERYDASQIQGPSLRKQLAELIEVAKRPL
jgi:hypothetical protein